MKQGWEIKRLDDACEVEYGTRVVNKRDGGTIYPVYGGGGATFFMDTFNREDCFIVARFAMSEQCTRFVKGKFFLNDSGLSVKPRNTKEILQDFLNLQLLYLNDHIYSLARGTAQKNLDVPAFRIIEINYPKSLPEQRRIVSILDEAFAAIAKAKANAEQNLKNAKELFESYLQGVFENGDWDEVKLAELAKDITDGDHMPPPKSEEGFPFITISNINKQNRQIDFSDTFKVPKQYYEKLKENRKPKKGDVLYTVTGSYGIPVLIEDDFQFCFQRHIGLIRPKENVSSKWLYYWILSPQALFQANDKATGTAQKTVSLTALRNFTLPNIKLKEQHNIVQKLDALSAETKKLETIYQQKINDLEELKKSVLQKAFSGELKTAEQCA